MSYLLVAGKKGHNDLFFVCKNKKNNIFDIVNIGKDRIFLIEKGAWKQKC